jgi:hypothetical protein
LNERREVYRYIFSVSLHNILALEDAGFLHIAELCSISGESLQYTRSYRTYYQASKKIGGDNQISISLLKHLPSSIDKTINTTVSPQSSHFHIFQVSLDQRTKHPPWRPPSVLLHEASSENTGNRQAPSSLMGSQRNHRNQRRQSWVLLIQRSGLYLWNACLRNGLPLPTGSRAIHRLLPSLPFPPSLLANLEALLLLSLIQKNLMLLLSASPIIL